MDYNYILELMRNELNKITRQTYKNKTQYAVFCPRCERHKKEGDTAHLYINVDIDKKYGYNIPIFSYDCKKCELKGRVMSKQMAIEIGIKNSELLEYLSNIKKSKFNTIKIVNRVEFCDLEIRNDYNLNETNIIKKFDYIYKRTKIDDLYERYSSYKIIPDIRKFFIDNKLEINKDYDNGKYNMKYILNNINKNYVSFLSMDKTTINSRDITDSQKNRYHVYKIYPNSVFPNSSNLYTISSTINTMNTNIELILAEGVFDILRIYNEFYNKESINKIYGSVQNKDGYPTFIRKMYDIGIMPSKIHIYSDSDVEIDYYKKYILPLVPGKKVLIYYNRKSKDFGNVNEPLELTKRTLLI